MLIKKKMSKKKMYEFIKSISRFELYEELERLCPGKPSGKSAYLKAVRVTLISLGYDTHWVEGDFRHALETYYLYNFIGRKMNDE